MNRILEVPPELSPQSQDTPGEYGAGLISVVSQQDFLPQEQEAAYLAYDLTVDWEYETGNQILVPSNDGSGLEQPVSVIPVAAASAFVYVRFSMARVGFPCSPPPVTAVDGAVLLYAKVQNKIPTPSVDANSAVYRVSGEYKYVLLEPGVIPVPNDFVPIPTYD